MRILIDVQGMQSFSNSNRGIGRYTRSFTESFIKEASEHEIFLLINGLFPDTVRSIKETFSAFLPDDRFIVFDALSPSDELNMENSTNTRLSELIREKLIIDLNPDLLLMTSLFEGIKDNSITSIGTYSADIPVAVIFYDLIPYMRQDEFLYSEALKTWYMKKIDSLKQADTLLAISFSAQNEAAVFLGKQSSELVTISSATDETFNPGNAHKHTLIQHGIERPFIMHTSAYEPRKNFEGLIEAFSLLPLPLRNAYQLVLVCKLSEKHRSDLEETAKKFGLKEKELILTGFISDEDLISLYTQAELFVFPSKHEGFGLPPLEAMACGTATIGSDVSSIPEVIGRADALFDPVDTESIARKIEEVLSDTAFHSSLKIHALKQAKKFSWQITAQKALSFLENKYQKTSLLPNEKKCLPDLRKSTDKLLNAIGKYNFRSPPSVQHLKAAAKIIARNEKVIISLMANGYYDQPLKWRIEGPFDSSYSLALLNRETARALDLLGVDVALHSTEGPGDFDPDPAFLAAHPNLAGLHQKALKQKASEAHVCSRNLYPPRVEDMEALCNMLHHYAWEESGFPQEWVANFNKSLDGMTCLSTHIEKIMVDNGVAIPMSVSGCGVDHWERIITDTAYSIEAKGFRFLHVSSCFPRKGADVLLKAYGDVFSAKDDVTLVIKTFPNPHNEIHHWLEEAKKEHSDYPDVLIIEEDLSESQLKALYKQCHTLVAPSRAEGFGLPLAEAMLSGLAVITTAWGGQLDFCNTHTAWLVDYDFVPAQTHFELFNSVWAEPSRRDLAEVMKEVHTLPIEIRTQKAENGRKLLLEKFTWEKTAENLLNFSKTLSLKEILFTKPKIGWITSWNTQCGIASYSKHLIDAMSQELTILAPHTDSLLESEKGNVHRCWYAGDGNKLNALEEKIDTLDLNTLVIQFNYSFYDFEYFPSFIHRQCNKGRKVVVMVHSTSDAPSTPHKKLSMLVSALERCDRILVHTPNDLNRLKSLGLTDNTALFPHGIPDALQKKPKAYSTAFTVASYGFFLPHKGLLELIETISIIKKRGVNIHLKMVNARYPVPQSSDLIEKAKEYIGVLGLEENIDLITDYLSDETCLEELSKADLIVFPYQETGESSSAAVRYGIASGSPVAVTPLKIFDDVESAVFKLQGSTPLKMAEGIIHLKEQIEANHETVKKKESDCSRWRESHRYSGLGKRLSAMLYASNRKI